MNESFIYRFINLSSLRNSFLSKISRGNSLHNHNNAHLIFFLDDDNFYERTVNYFVNLWWFIFVCYVNLRLLSGSNTPSRFPYCYPSLPNSNRQYSQCCWFAVTRLYQNLCCDTKLPILVFYRDTNIF